MRMGNRNRIPLLQDAQTSLSKTTGRILLGALLVFTGVSHLTFARRDFHAQVPKSLPFSKDFTVVASGIAEIALGLSLIFLRRQRIPVGLVSAAFFIAIFPGNIAQYLNHANAFGLDTDKKRLVRLFFQPPLVIWALWSTNAWAWLRARNEGETRSQMGADALSTNLKTAHACATELKPFKKIFDVFFFFRKP